MSRLLFSVLAILLFISYSKAQTPRAMSSADILLGMKKLNTLGSVLYIAAHPDDENTRLLAYLAKEKLYRTGYLSLTRGDGGQNLIGNEQGIELGLIRTQELLAARRIDGAEQFFSTAYDFGFCKTTTEALNTWNEQKILGDAVWVIRRFQPDVIITRFPKDSRAGHGHHSASAVIAEKAFFAAADPSQFPEQLKYVQSWQAKRLLWNTYNFGSGNTQSEDQFKMDVGAYNPLLGKSYGEIASESRSQHKSQGFGVARQRGEALEYFATWQGEAPQHDLLDNVITSWKRIPDGEAIQQKIDAVINNFSFTAPGKSVTALVDIYRSISRLKDSYWKRQKLQETIQLIEACSGLWLDATTDQPFVAQTDSLKINFSLLNRNGNHITLNTLSVNDFDTTVNMSLANNKNVQFSYTQYVPDNTKLSQPYWLRRAMLPGSFDVENQLQVGNPENDPSFAVKFTLNIEGENFEITKPVRQKYTDPVKGEIYQPVAIVPPVVITPAKTLNLSYNQQPQTIQYNVKAMKDIYNPEFSLSLVKDWKAEYERNMKTDPLLKNGEEDISVTLTPSKNKTNGSQDISAAVRTIQDTYTSCMRTINYDHIPSITYFRMPVSYLLTLDLKTAGKKIGYIEGAGDYIPAALQQMGYEVTTLSDNDLANKPLGQYDAIITGVRAYNIKSSLNVHYDKLMKYVQDGGNLIVQYNTSTQIGPLKAKIGPYPFDISRTRVTDEKAVVKVLQPNHAIMNFPNKITEQDFNGWIQERSIYHAAKWDNHYTTIFSMNDEGEAADEGSLITTQYGKGTFTYTGLVFFRELPAGVPGAYRLLANIIALNKIQK